MKRHPIYMAVWYFVNGLLALSILLAIYSMAWEYSTRRYLKGFSDAIVPLGVRAEEKVRAILLWMERGPTRMDTSGDSGEYQLRDPFTTLNYKELLRTCGTATNAFVNLSIVSQVPARRLLLMDRNWSAKHVLAEVELDGRWVVVDPTFRVVFRSADGRPLTRLELSDPVTFKQATEDIPGYVADYSFERTAHVRVTKIRHIGPLLRSWLDRYVPGWSESVLWTLLLERESFAASVAAILLIIVALLARFTTRWYGEYRFGIRMFRARETLAAASKTFLRGPS